MVADRRGAPDPPAHTGQRRGVRTLKARVAVWGRVKQILEVPVPPLVYYTPLSRSSDLRFKVKLALYRVDFIGR